MKNATINPPAGLSPESAVWWAKILTEYAIDDPAGLLLLENAMRARDRMVEAAAIIAVHGVVTVDRFGQLRPNPATILERDSRAGMQAALKALNLDLEPLRDSAGRPAGR